MIAVSLAASVALHIGALAWLGFSGRWPRAGPISAEAISASVSETVLTFSEPAVVEAPPVVAEPPPAEDPAPPEPEPVAAELTTAPPEAIVPEPAPVVREPPRQVAPPVVPATKPAAPPATSRNTVFAGVQARRAQRIVYVVDASGPMASSLAFVKGELARSIGSLQADQSFQVLFFRETAGAGSSRGSDPGYVAMDSGGGSPTLISASAEAKKGLQSWLGTIRPSGRSSPQPALEEAVRLGPDLIFVLSRRIKRTNLADAAGEARQVLAALDRLNPMDTFTGRRAVVIKTIQFLDDDPSGLLQGIAQAHGDGEGSYKLLTLDRLPRK